MRVVHNSLRDKITQRDCLEEGRAHTQEEEWQQTSEQIIKTGPVNEQAYNRLMVVCRKEQEYDKEQAVIEGGIRAFEAIYHETKKRTAGKKVTRLSNALLQPTGLADQKSHLLYEPEPIGRWNKRKLAVEKRFK